MSAVIVPTGVRIPDGWPPGEYDRSAIEFFKERLLENPAHSGEGRGYATELVGALVEYAFSTENVERIIAHTAPGNIGSIRILEKTGFSFISPGKDIGTIRYERKQ